MCVRLGRSNRDRDLEWAPAPQGMDSIWSRTPPAALASEVAVCSGGRAGGGASLSGQRIRVAPEAKRPSPRP